jgi:hypothetical protein
VVARQYAAAGFGKATRARAATATNHRTTPRRMGSMASKARLPRRTKLVTFVCT